MISFVETKLFTRLVQEYLSDDEYSRLQQALAADPELGSVIAGSGGVRKMRWRGRSGKTWRPSHHLLSAHSAWSDLDAYALREERGREYSRPRVKADQG